MVCITTGRCRHGQTGRRSPATVLVGTALFLGAACLAHAETTADPRSVVLLERRCEQDESRRIVTLYANGTIRLLEVAGDGEERLHLAELSPEELAEYERQLRVSTPSDSIFEEERGVGVEGIRVEQCELLLAPPGRPEIRYRFAPLEVATLRFARHLAIAEALYERVRPKPKVEKLDDDYIPALGHILRDTAGDRYKVTWVSIDGWVEMDGLDQPFHLVLHLNDLRLRFVARADLPPPP